MCENRTLTGDPCAENTDSDLSLYLWVFIAGRVLHGIGAVPLYTVSVTFLDDCVSKEQFSFYVGKAARNCVEFSTNYLKAKLLHEMPKSHY